MDGRTGVMMEATVRTVNRGPGGAVAMVAHLPSSPLFSLWRRSASASSSGTSATRCSCCCTLSGHALLQVGHRWCQLDLLLARCTRASGTIPTLVAALQVTMGHQAPFGSSRRSDSSSNSGSGHNVQMTPSLQGAVVLMPE